MICIICIIARWLALLLASANNPVTSDVQVIWTHVTQPHLIRRQPTCDVSWPPDAPVVCELWLAVSEIAPRPVTSLTCNKLCLADPSSTNCTSRWKIHSVIVKRTVQMSLTLKQLNEVTTVLLRSTWKVMGKLCWRIPSPSTSSLTNDVTTWSRRRYCLSTLSPETSRLRPSADAVARHRTLTARLQRCAGFPRRVSTACRHCYEGPDAACRHCHEGPDAYDTTVTLSRCSSSLSLPPVDARLLNCELAACLLRCWLSCYYYLKLFIVEVSLSLYPWTSLYPLVIPVATVFILCYVSYNNYFTYINRVCNNSK